jgi:hypothetical protein
VGIAGIKCFDKQKERLVPFLSLSKKYFCAQGHKGAEPALVICCLCASRKRQRVFVPKGTKERHTKRMNRPQKVRQKILNKPMQSDQATSLVALH